MNENSEFPQEQPSEPINPSKVPIPPKENESTNLPSSEAAKESGLPSHEPTQRREDDPESFEGEIVPLPPGAESRLKAVGADPNDPTIRRALMVGTAFAGPIPPPDMLLDYKRVHPDLPGTIVSWTNNQISHRMALENTTTIGAETRMNRGQVFTFCITALGLSLSAAEGIYGSATVGSILAIVSIGGPASAFVMARSFNWGRPDRAATNEKSLAITQSTPAASTPPTPG